MLSEARLPHVRAVFLDGERNWPRYAGTVLLVALVYFLSALAGNSLRFTGNVDAIWPPAGVGIAAVYLLGPRIWPGILLGDLLADYPHHLPILVSVGQTTGNMLEALVPAMLLARYMRRSPLANLDSLAILVLCIMAGTALSATIGGLSLLAGDVTSVHDFATVWRTWFLGDTCGALLIVPLVLAWIEKPESHIPKRSRLELFAVALTLVTLSEVALRASPPLAYLAFPPIIWAAVRFGARGGTLAAAVTTSIAVIDTAREEGPFAMHSITLGTITLQLYIATTILTALGLTAMVGERRLFTRRLAEARTRLSESAENERRRLERNLHDGAQQRLSALSIRLRSATLLREPDQYITVMHRAGEELDLALDELRELARGIHPTLLTRFGLAIAVDAVAARSTIDAHVDINLGGERLESLVEATAYYLVAEAVSNAQRHSRATNAFIRVAKEGDVVLVSVRDDGIGGAVERPDSGLSGLRDRVEGIGGSFAITSPVGVGTTVLAGIPLHIVDSD
jgi:signal transduction histidine kinase